jgi:hypothetical protein
MRIGSIIKHGICFLPNIWAKPCILVMHASSPFKPKIMKKLLLLPALVLLYLQGFTQICGSPQSSIDLNANRIRARVLNSGTLFNNGVTGQFILDQDPNSGLDNASTIFSAGLWIGAMDPAINLKMAAGTYYDFDRTDFWPGPLAPDGTTNAFDCSNWDRHFRVTGSQIADFLNQLTYYKSHLTEAIADFPGILGWPGKGNPHFSTIHGYSLPNNTQDLAPFFDADADGKYNALKGDYPAVHLKDTPAFIADEIVWSVYNDQGNGGVHKISGTGPLQIEVQQTSWAFSCSAQPNSVLDRTIFTAHRIIYRGNEVLDSCFAGVYVDFALGCANDDYIGCAPTQNSFYAYNQTAVDGSIDGDCGSGAAFLTRPPAQAVTFLNGPLQKMMAFRQSSANTPTKSIHFYNYLTGRWPDGTPPTAAGTGYNPVSSGTPIDFMFPGNPDQNNAWSMCAAMLANGNRAAIGATKIGRLLPGQSTELVLGWSVHTNTQLPCNIGNTLQEIGSVQTAFDTHFQDVCSIITKAPEPAPDSIQVFPNPANGVITLQFGALKINEVQLFASDGRLVKRWKNLAETRATLSVEDLAQGFYVLQLHTAQGVFTQKVCISR